MNNFISSVLGFLSIAWSNLCILFNNLCNWAMAFFKFRLTVRTVSLALLIMLIPFLVIRCFISYAVKKRRIAKNVRKGN